MGIGYSKDSVEQSLKNTVVNETINNNFQENITKIINQASQTSTNINTFKVSDIVCGGDITLGNINQTISINQELGSISKSLQQGDVKLMLTSALDAAQAAALKQVDNPDFEPFIGMKEKSVKQNIVNEIRNKIENNNTIQNFYEELNQQMQEASNMNKANIRDIVCGGNFKLGDVNQNIQANQVASKLSDVVSKAIADTATKIETKATQTGEASQESKGLAGIIGEVMKGPQASSMMSAVASLVCGCIVGLLVFGMIFLFKGSGTKGLVGGKQTFRDALINLKSNELGSTNSFIKILKFLFK
jgi:hypothetical protein